VSEEVLIEYFTHKSTNLLDKEINHFALKSAHRPGSPFGLTWLIFKYQPKSGRQVQRYAPLIAVPGAIVAATEPVLFLGRNRLDLDDLRNEISQDAGGIRPGKHPGEVKDADGV